MKTFKLFIIPVIIMFSTVIYGQKKYQITDIQILDDNNLEIELSKKFKKLLGTTIDITELDNSLIVESGNGDRTIYKKESSSLRTRVYTLNTDVTNFYHDKSKFTIHLYPFTNEFEIKTIRYWKNVNTGELGKKDETSIIKGKEL